MARTLRITPGGIVYHVLNRGVHRMQLFERGGDYLAFEAVMEEAKKKHPMRICAYCVMPTHWHLVLWPEGDHDLTSFTQWLTMTHAARWLHNKQCVGRGHVYQGRFKSFPVADDEHFYRLVRYVERNPLRANLVQGSECWKWSSLWRRLHGTPEEHNLLSPWPEPEPQDWLEFVNTPLTEAELEAVRTSVVRNRPYGAPEWIVSTARRMGLESTLRERGRPPLC